MNFGNFAKAFAPVAAIAMAAALSGCDGATFKINGEEGKKLSELDMTGAAPNELALLGPDEVHVTTGDKLKIDVSGDPDATDALRFTLKDGTLGILRKDKVFGGSGKTAVVNVTMPALREVTMAGSGKIVLDGLAKEASVNITGSGAIESDAIETDKLDVNIAGSGSFRAAGNTRQLKLNVLGSGNTQLDALQVETAKVDVAGSGHAVFASDGEVKANILGSGEVRVRGRARCTVSALGSGRLVCEPAPETKAAPPAPEAPAAPEAPHA
jgi:hypothetical protein